MRKSLPAALEVTGFWIVAGNCLSRFFLTYSWGIYLVIGIFGFLVYLLALKLVDLKSKPESQQSIYRNNAGILLVSTLIGLYLPCTFVLGSLLVLISLVIIFRSIKNSGPIPRKKGSYSPIAGF